MEKIVLGRTKLEASVLGLGGGGDSRLGTATGADPSVSVKLVRSALDAGVNFIDTAEAYGTEEVIGAALREVPRQQVIVSSKKTTRSGEVTPRSLTESLEQSLRRLGTRDCSSSFSTSTTSPGSEALRACCAERCRLLGGGSAAAVAALRARQTVVVAQRLPAVLVSQQPAGTEQRHHVLNELREP